MSSERSGPNGSLEDNGDYLPLEVIGDESSLDENHVCEDVIMSITNKHVQCLARFSNNELLAKDTIGQNALHMAARVGDLNILKYLLDRLPELRDIQSANGETAAHISAAHGDMRALEMLLGGPLKTTMNCAMTRDINGTSILMASVARGDTEMAIWLLRKFGKGLALLDNNCKMLPVHVAAAQGNIEFLRAAIKFDNQMVNARDEFGCTPCVYAVQGGCLGTVRFLVEKARSEMGSVSNRGQSLLHIACLCGHEHIVRWILNRSGSDSILWTTNDRANAIHCAAYAGSVPVLSQLLSAFSKKKRHYVMTLRDTRGNTPLHLAAMNNHLDAALYMLENGADPALINSNGHSPQSIAALRHHREMERLVAAYQGKKRKSKSKKKSQSMHDLSQFASLQSGPLSPGGVTSYSSNTNGFETTERRAFSPRELSSGYSSNGDVAESIKSEAEIVRHRLRFIEDDVDSLRDTGAQTDMDLLQTHVKVLDDKTWAGLGLSAVEHIDRVLDELEFQE
ncbi:hypothetical protein CRE_12607 [Caenorhabditis remanei]|uniref:Uncharacterized protein n=1 Tax=Caenorhabditis remanei TaxID=31234 RepID=E3M7W4_CAERE|nr:hypothetical protein CRE_12607 [Caenorhabditis remanei]